jgi:hypothetical protein
VTGLLLGLLVLFVLAGIGGHYSDRLRKHGPHALAFRWFAASAGWHGKPVTNRGFARPGTKALTPTGHAHRRWYWPQWQHALWRTGWTLVTLLLAADLLLQFRRTLAYLGVTAAGCAGYGTLRGWAWAQSYGHHRNYVKPLHVRLAPKAGIPAAMDPRSWLEVPRDRSYAVLTWPKGAALPKPQERDEIASAAASTLGIAGAIPKWQLTGPQLKLHLRPPVPCPDRVGLADILEAIRGAGVNDLILGVGQEAKITSISLLNDSPHIGLSMDTGKGKSVTVRCIVAQILLRGGIALVLDNKLVSHPSLRGLPNVAYADGIAKVHDAGVWLDGELDRRARYIRDNTDIYGNLTGSPGPPLVIVAEELNLTMARLRAYWEELCAEDRTLPKASPAVRGLANCSFVGRELKVYELFVGQRLSATATGGGSKGADVRMNIGTRLLAGYDDDTWKMLVGKQTPMPPPSRHAGRVQVYVKGSGLTETQIAFFTHRETRQFAESGTSRVPAELRHLTVFSGPAAAEAPPARDLLRDAPPPSVTAIAAPPPAPLAPGNLMTIRQAREAGMLPRNWTTSGAFRTAKHRAARAGMTVPGVRAMKGSEAMYDAADLADFLDAITTERRS